MELRNDIWSNCIEHTSKQLSRTFLSDIHHILSDFARYFETNTTTNSSNNNDHHASNGAKGVVNALGEHFRYLSD